MQLRKILLSSSLILSIGVFAACNSGGNANNSSSESTASSTQESSVDLSKVDLPQLSNEVTDDEYLVEMDTTVGNIKIKLFPKEAPKTVENFVTHAKDGYYNGTTFHRVVNDFMIQGGDPKGDGTGGESIWGDPFEDEISPSLYNIRGALSMANAGENTNGSQFFIVQNKDDQSDGLAIQYTPEKIIEAYKNGGTPSLDGKHAVFGQVTEGMDIVDKIAGAETKANSQGEDSTPVDPVKINEIKILQEPKE
ncbi:peptidylprolyl isomerase [Enterococcus pallens]|uniref:Peptidyl-prolyl cis-trans isomerase n=1 Tax=Enterococcus pallens ATCC BAA-351 TaxID=1158607 RepID=R2SJX8_9ENTE|nr:peptidylprolyl isomerase [Enterococcus pallens]EOH88484.1 cyclophilin type peptidyl-prolyl cis-trans isomerase [Enterococcus pallens ATCC BAA-351]EOU17665.1 cyclophilin type peptidyl-prolyl cis-trans isomerase [Enterococcus pallens ATCC BAA-351]OJG81540.1 cyclophilin type peptidyl-prolyl cis-trans isomerase [Enterococcus pallens]